MVGILHIIKRHGDDIALDIIREQLKFGSVSVLLMQDGVLDCDKLGLDITTYASKSDVVARGIKTWIELLDYDGIVDLIFNSEKVICW
ncbi:MAG TPA: DsrH/TusB family sulfur metabolism protein [Candidatus Nanoarchaeia archaeon]|nr:DsrH/TusB family sulfur metabolism protein [Candidatus Nanoarchaeia archaeon]